MQKMRFSIETKASGTYHPVARNAIVNGQKSVTAPKKIHQDWSVRPPSTNIEIDIV